VLDASLLVHATMAARFLDEARAVNRIRHPNIVNVFAFGELADGRPYLVMDLLEGIDLREVVAAGLVEPEEVAELLAQVCDALSAAHRAGIIHRDLKPENIFVVRGAAGRLEARLLDFGIAKALDASSEAGAEGGRTAIGFRVGTPRYMAPEQFTGGVLEPTTDLYAMGLLLHEAFADAWPWPEITGPADHMRAHTELPPVIAPSLLKKRPKLAKLIAACLDKRPAARPGTASILAKSIRDCAGEADAGIFTALRQEKAPPAPAPVAKPRIEPWVLVAVGGLVVLVVVIFALLKWAS
jgi:serine/threonine-protein kinase